MANWFSCYRAILGQSLREAASWKRNLLFVFAGLGVAAVLTMVVVMVGDRRNQNDIFGMVLMVTFFQLLVPITSIYFSASILREEISSRTIVYLLSGPVPRSSVWLAKYSASVIVSLFVVLSSFGLAVAAISVLAPSARSAAWALQPSTIQGSLLAISLGPFAYAAIGTLLAVRFKWAILWGAGFFIVWESFVGSVPQQSGLRSLTVVDSLRTLLFHHTPAAERLHENLFKWATAGGQDGLDIPSVADAFEALGWFVGVPLLLTVWIGRGRDFESGAKDGQ